jgi:hypothetical protein
MCFFAVITACVGALITYLGDDTYKHWQDIDGNAACQHCHCDGFFDWPLHWPSTRESSAPACDGADGQR